MLNTACISAATVVVVTTASAVNTSFSKFMEWLFMVVLPVCVEISR
jgi:hypothetical protein